MVYSPIMLDSFVSVAAAVFFAWICWGVGGTLVARHLKRWPSATARHVVSFAAGNIVYSCLLSFLGAGGLFFRNLFLVLLGAGLLLALARTAKTKEENGFPKPHRRDWGILLLVPFFAPSLLMALAPPFIRDALVYHLALPKLYLAAHGLTDIPGNFYSAFPKGQEMLWTLLLSVGGDRAPQVFSLLQHLVACLGVYALIKHRYGYFAAALGALGYGGTPVAAYFSGCAYVEPAIALMLISGIMIIAERESLTPTALSVMLGAVSGFLIAIKYTGLLYAGLYGLVLLALVAGNGWRAATRHALLFALAALPGCFWLIRNLLMIGNPVFPFAFGLFGGAGWDAERALTYSIYLHNYGLGRMPLDYLLLPLRLAWRGHFDSMEFDGFIGPLAPIFLVLAIVGVWLDRRGGKNPWLPLIGTAMLVSLAFFMFGTQQVRFYLPTQLFACVLSAPVLSVLSRRLQGRRRLAGAVALLVAALLIFNGYRLCTEIKGLNLTKVALGLESREDFLMRKAPGYPAIDYYNRTAGPDQKILCVFTGNYGYYFKHPMISDSFVEDYTLRRLLDAPGENPAVPFTQEGITHLMVNSAILAKSESLNQMQKAKFATILKRFGIIEFNYGNYFIFKFTSN